MSSDWYARPVWFVADAERSRGFYVDKLRFAEDWRYEEEGRLLIVQVARAGCELILTEQWPDKAGGGLVFVSLDPEEFEAAMAQFAAAAAGVDVSDGRWGYDLKVVTDPDGNQLYFPLPGDA